MDVWFNMFLLIAIFTVVVTTWIVLIEFLTSKFGRFAPAISVFATSGVILFISSKYFF